MYPRLAACNCFVTDPVLAGGSRARVHSESGERDAQSRHVGRNLLHIVAKRGKLANAIAILIPLPWPRQRSLSGQKQRHAAAAL
jgi:hypothetical protein